MKHLIFILVFLPYCNFAQDILNPYKDYATSTYPDWPINNISGFQYSHYSYLSNQGYTGEYEIDIKTIPNIWYNDFANLAKSYKIESVSFPFTMPCAFEQTTACADGTTDRDLYMPVDAYDGSDHWGHLSREMINRGVFDYNQTQLPPTHQTLVSYAFVNTIQTPIPIGRTILPHTILKHTLTIHCGPYQFYNDPITEISWYYDNTRGGMRYYPFTNTNVLLSGPTVYDIIFFPDFLSYNTGYANSNNNLCTNYSTLNYFPSTEITNQSNCQLQGTSIPPSGGGNFGQYVYPSDNLLVSAPARSWDGNFLAGYQFVQPNTPLIPDDNTVSYLGGSKQNYFINKGFPDLDLNWINPNEKIIFNPSEVSVISQTSAPTNLIFPSLYTFKTILGVYPSLQEANDANTLANGGPFSSLRDVPVPVNASDLMQLGGNQNDYPEVNWNDPNTIIDDRYGYYYIENLGQITVEPCVKIFDAKFEVKAGGTLLFEDYTQTKNPNRFTINSTGGVIAKNYLNIQYLQNTLVTQPQSISYIAVNEIYAGSNVDPNQSPISPFVLESGSNIEFLAGDAIYLKDGFSAKQGSSFYAHCSNIQMSLACPSGWRLAHSGNSNYNKESAPNQVLTITPNPTSNIVSIECKSIDDGILYIYDISGRVIIQELFDKVINLNASSLAAGIYLAEVMNKKSYSVKGKIIKE